MTQTILYCFRNRTIQTEEQLKKTLNGKDIEYSITPTNCMKLCIFCEKLNVAIVNHEVVMEKNEDQFITKILEKLV